PKTPPPRVMPKIARPPRKILPVDPFPTPRVEIPREPIPASPPVNLPTLVISPPLTIPPQVPQTRTAITFEVAEIAWGAEDADQPSSTSSAEGLVRQEIAQPDQSWATRLATPESLREAIVLREIFGPPRSMQALEATGNA
ncbi:MAG: hypothetical protein M3032_05525, partial [Verrucomicrobiota bacterium]|nr:hypothetical protein [Verrucomicrobiota bacterium]